jgi:ribosomal protein S18 acetylase RimI-like enzyme
MYQDMEYKVNIREMQKADVPHAAEVLGKAFATTPGTLAIYSGNPTAALRFQNVFEAGFKHPKGRCFVAELDDRIVGGMRIVKSPDCYTFSLKLIPAALSAARGLGPLMRLMKFIDALRKHDPKQPHWHLTFLGVAPDFQGKGIGSKMMVFYCDIVDRDRMEAYHEAGPDSVHFYERFGFKVVGEETINGVKNYYVLRPAKSDK